MRFSGRKSITFRLTLLFASASTIVLLILGYLIGGSVEQHFADQDMDVLTGKLELVQHDLQKILSRDDLDTHLAQQLDDSLVGHPGLAVVVETSEGQKLFATSGAEFPQALLDRDVKTDPGRPITWRTRSNQPLRGISALAPTGINGAPPVIVAVATDISHHVHFMKSFQVTLWSFVFLAAMLTGLLGWVAVRRGLRPLQAIKRKAADITAHRLDSRLPVDAVPVELLDLVETLNQMLTRLENSFRKLSDFSSDLAHEFRTPVSNLMTQTQVTLSRPRTPDEYRDVLASNVEEFERLSRMISDMLFIAKADEGQIVPSHAKITLGRVAEQLVEFYQLIADEKSVVLTHTGDGEMMGDSLMIRRAISNLLSNAIRHTATGGRVSIRIEPSDRGQLRIVVENSGESIPATHIPRLFDRFYRVDSSRHWEGTHSGLGLAIVKSIVQAHGGEVSVASASGMTSFVLVLPRAN